MRIVICDDVKKYNNQLNKMLKNYMKRNQIDDCEIKEYTSSLDLFKEYSSGMFDYVFLDIEMPELNGFELADHIIKLDRKAVIVFVTVMADQVYNSFHYKAKGYLCKPIDQKKIDGLMDRLLEERNYKEENDLYSINIKAGGTAFLYLPDVLYFESDNNYVVSTSKNDIYTFRSSMDTVLADLKEKGFVRVSRKHIVNRLHVFKVFGDHIVLKTGENFSIGRAYKHVVRESFRGVW